MSEKNLKPIFSGDKSREMWSLINNAKTINDLEEALYTVCCKLQTLEHRLERGEYGKINQKEKKNETKSD